MLTALGLHPQLAHERKSELSLFDQILPNCAYVGEVGLDEAPEFKRHWQDQIDVLRHVLEACERVGGGIMSIHSRRASTPVLEALEAPPVAGVPVLYWFSGAPRELDRAAALGCWFSVGPGSRTHCRPAGASPRSRAPRRSHRVGPTPQPIPSPARDCSTSTVGTTVRSPEM